MLTYLIKRLVYMIPLLLGIITVSFIVIHLAPGRPTTLQEAMNPKISLEARQRLNQLYGLDKPLSVQYLNWIKGFIRFDFGNSFIDNRKVTEKILERLPLTLFMNLISLAIILFCGIFLALKSAARPDSLTDKAVSIASFISFASPGFWIALLLIGFFGVNFHLLPISGIKSLDFEYFDFWDKLIDLSKHLILPIFVSSIAGVGAISRYMRQNLLEISKFPFIRAAMAKGLSYEAVLKKHALPNALLAVITILGLSIPSLLGGSVIFESIFALPGLGRLFYEAVMSRDYPMIMAELSLGAILTLIGNLAADIGYALVDPRIRLGDGK